MNTEDLIRQAGKYVCFSGDPNNPTDPYGYRADRARGNLQRRLQAEIEKRQSEESYNTVVTYNLTEPVQHLKFFIGSNGSDHIEPTYGNTILHLLVQDLACFQSTFGAYFSDEEAQQKMDIMQAKINKICYFLEEYGYKHIKNKRKFTVIETFLYTLPIFSSKKKSLVAIKAEEKLVKILARLLVYASAEDNDIKSYQKKLLKKGYPLAADCLIDEIKIADKEKAERANLDDQSDDQEHEESSYEAPGGLINIEDIIDNINPSVDEENPLYPMLETEMKARERAEAREKEEIDKRVAVEAKITNLELQLRLLQLAVDTDVGGLPEQQNTSGSRLFSFEKSKDKHPSLHDQAGTDRKSSVIIPSIGNLNQPKDFKILRK